MAWRRPQQQARIEAPEWYRNYHPEAWDEPDGHELSMMNGCAGVCGRAWPGAPDWPGAGSYSRHQCWPQFLHDQHARRRWQQAQHAYRQAHPEFQTQEFNDLLARHGRR